ncbi:glycosyltransferase family 4 protein [Geotalea uraniireducens]|nr:glycosyltransferase family 4 protein [Geotalea uraniireducens]
MAGTFSFPEGGDGASRALHMQAKGLAQAGHEVLVAVCCGTLEGRKSDLDGFKVKSFVSSSKDRKGMVAPFFWIYGQLGMLLYLLYVTLARRFDTIIYYGAAPVFAIAAVAGKFLKRHTCVVEGDLMAVRWQKLLFNSEEILARNVSLIIVGGSSVLEQHFTKIAPNTKCLRLWPPTDTDYFGSGSSIRARKKLNLSDAPLIVYAGAISKLEGVDVLIESMKYVIEKCPEAKLIIAGPIVEHDAIIGKPLDYKGLVEELGLAGVVFFTGKLLMPEVADLLAAANVLVNPKVEHPANWVAAPIKIGEYLASGSPIVTTSVCELEVWLSDRRDVLFCKAGDSVELAKGICDILTDTVLSDQLSRQGVIASRRVCDFRVWGIKVIEAIEMDKGGQMRTLPKKMPLGRNW